MTKPNYVEKIRKIPRLKTLLKSIYKHYKFIEFSFRGDDLTITMTLKNKYKQ